MRKNPWMLLCSFALITVAALLYGCGQENETNVPVVKLTASAITSQPDVTTHTHLVSIPFTDVSAAPLSTVYQYRSEVSNGHSHVIALSKAQMIDLNNGQRLMLTSSTPNTGSDHSHIWSIQGGDVLYEKFCYNCHSNDKRGHSPMNVSFTGGQSNAVINPAAAPLSSSAAALPDPAYTSAVAILDGTLLYANNCSLASCHGPLATSSKSNRTAAQIRTAINSINAMSSLGALTDAQLQAIATALIK